MSLRVQYYTHFIISRKKPDRKNSCQASKCSFWHKEGTQRQQEGGGAIQPRATATGQLRNRLWLKTTWFDLEVKKEETIISHFKLWTNICPPRKAQLHTVGFCGSPLAISSAVTSTISPVWLPGQCEWIRSGSRSHCQPGPTPSLVYSSPPSAQFLPTSCLPPKRLRKTKIQNMDHTSGM